MQKKIEAHRHITRLPLVAGLMLAMLLSLLVTAGCSNGTDGDEGTITSTPAAPAATAATTAPMPTSGPDGVGTVVDSSDGAGTYVDITSDELAAMLQSKDFILINTHIPYEGEIAQTDLFLPYDQAAQLVGKLPPEKDARIVVYCRSDRMSRIAIEEWLGAGYTNLYNLAGGFVAWEAAGYELLDK